MNGVAQQFGCGSGIGRGNRASVGENDTLTAAGYFDVARCDVDGAELGGKAVQY